ncbi:MAG: hypothetical protein J1E41_03240, partial [Ruminococcus sp.]|nr:hypothetical protein [Ruminococcus sp.]
YMVFCLIMDIFEINWAVFNVQMIIGVFISCGVFIVMSIFKNAYFGITQKSYSKASVIYIVLLAAIGIMNVFIGVFNMHDGETLFTDGALNLYSVNFLTAIFLLIITVALIIKVIVEKRTVVEE